MAIKITFGNTKGGVGKTTMTYMMGIIYSLYYKKKVLIIDLDPQADCTTHLAHICKKPLATDYTGIFEALNEGSATQHIYPLTAYLDLLPSSNKLLELKAIIEAKNISRTIESGLLVRSLVEEIEHDYDFILIDVPPSMTDFTTNAIMASDYHVGVLQTETKSYEQMMHFVIDTANISKALENNPKFQYTGSQLLGIAMYLADEESEVDYTIMMAAHQKYRDMIFNTRIYKNEIIKKHTLKAPNFRRLTKIEKKAFSMYHAIAEEMLIRIGELPPETVHVRTTEYLENVEEYLTPEQKDQFTHVLEAGEYYKDVVLEDMYLSPSLLKMYMKKLLSMTYDVDRKLYDSTMRELLESLEEKKPKDHYLQWSKELKKEITV